MTDFKYGKTEMDHLKKSDPILGKVIDRTGIIKRQITADPFSGLIFNIIGQQISAKAACTICNRLSEVAGEITPENIISLEGLNSVGIPKQKVKYIRGIAESILSGSFPIGDLDALSDDEVTKLLISLPGIGKWTADMFMIFSLQRKDVLSWGDFGIRKGISLLYNEKIFNETTFNLYKSRYSPYSSIASFYLWAVAYKST